MVKLSFLLREESEAAKEAKKLGLKHIGFGRYVKPDDPDRVVAKSVQGKLVRIKSPYKQHKRELIPAKRVKDKEKKPEAQLSFDDILFPKLKVQKGGKPKSIGEVSLTDFNDSTDPHHYIRDEIVGGEQTIIYAKNADRPRRNGDEQVEGWETTINAWLFLKGSSGEYAPGGTAEATKNFQKYLNNPKMLEDSIRAANDQHKRWRSQLSDYDWERLGVVQQEWQRDSTWNSSDRPYMNRVINDYCTRKNRPEVTFTKEANHLERGMSLSPRDAAEFLKTFKVGSTVVMPPSGWSYRPTTARDLLPSDWTTDPDMEDLTDDEVTAQIVQLLGAGEPDAEGAVTDNYARHIGVLLKLHPKGGSSKMTGIQCGAGDTLMEMAAKKAGVDLYDPPEEPIYDTIIDKYDLPEPRREDFESDEEYHEAFTDWNNEVNTLLNQDYEEWMAADEEWRAKIEQIEDRWNEISQYDNEHEVIRPGTTGQKVLSVKKHVFPVVPKDQTAVTRATVIFEIELEDVGDVSEDQIIESANDTTKRITF